MVLVYSEDHKITLELLNKGQELAKGLDKKLVAACIGHDHHQELFAHGASAVFVAETDQHQFKAEEYAEILDHIMKDTKSETILIGSTKNGKELAARLAARLDAGCVMDCTNITVKGKHVVTERVVYSGNAVAIEEFTSHPQVVTIPPKLYTPLPKNDAHTGEVTKKKFDVSPTRSKIVKVHESKSEGVNVEDAEIIVSCGRGLKKKEDIQIISELADALKGRTVGCSRPIAADLKWLSEDHWIGLSGHKVRPKLYVACGISGQIQHIAGMRDSSIVVAINKDPEALIFKSADYGIVGDLYQVVPKLTSAIKAKIG